MHVQNWRRMMCVILLQICLFLIVLNPLVDSAMTDAQIKAAGKLVRNMCQPKHKATDEDIDKMHSGDWNVDRTAMCYMQCVLASQKLMTKENTMDIEMAIDLAKKKLPQAIRDATLDMIEKCKDSAKTLDDKCVVAWEVSKCIYEANPEIYFLP